MNDRVLKKLRNKFFVILVGGFSTIIVLAVVIIYFTSAISIKLENENKLNSWTGGGEEQPLSFVIDESGNIVANPPDSQLFTIKIDEKGEILNLHSNGLQIDNQIEEMVYLVMNQSLSSNKFILEDRVWLYSIKQSDGLLPLNILSEISIGEIVFENDDFFIEDSIESFSDYLLSQFNNAEYHYLIFLDITNSTHELSMLFRALLSGGALMILGVIGVSYFFSNHAIKPIAESLERQKQFIENASHELKTPLMIINSNYDVLVDNKEEVIENQIKWLDYIKFGADRMTNLTNDLLMLAQIDQPNMNFQKTTFDINQVAKGVISSMEAKRASKKILISTTLESPLLIHQDLEKITQVVIILLDNAIKYTNNSGWIEVKTFRTKRHVTFTVKNSGAGIREEHLSKIFERFYRSDPSRNSGSKGYGLGLAIAKVIIEKSGGKIEATSVENEVTTFSFTLKE